MAKIEFPSPLEVYRFISDAWTGLMQLKEHVSVPSRGI